MANHHLLASTQRVSAFCLGDLGDHDLERNLHEVEWRDPTQQEVRRALGQAKGSASVLGHP